MKLLMPLFNGSPFFQAYLLNFRIGRYSSVVVSSTLNEVNESSQWCHQAMKAASIALYALVVLHYSVYLLCSKIAGDSSNITERTEQFEEHVKSFPTRLEVATDFIIQVSNLVEYVLLLLNFVNFYWGSCQHLISPKLRRLVDSRDIIKFQIKHQDFEIIIRKKEELPAIMMESNSQLS